MSMPAQPSSHGTAGSFVTHGHICRSHPVCFERHWRYTKNNLRKFIARETTGQHENARDYR